MATYSWAVDSNGQWTTPSNWGSTTYPNNLIDVVRFSKPLTAPRTVTLSSDVSVQNIQFAVGANPSSNYTIAGTSKITFASNGYIQVASTQFPNANTDIYPQLVSQPSSPIGIRSQGVDGRLVLKNPNNQIYQISAAGTLTYISIGFDSVACLGIQHPTYIFDSSVTSANYNVSLSSEGTGGTLTKRFWQSGGTGTPYLHLHSNGTLPFKVGLGSTKESLSLWSLRLYGSMPPYSETNDNEFANDVALTTFTKYGSCRWILSGLITNLGSGSFSLSIQDGILQIPLDKINQSTYATVAAQTSADSCFEISGTGTVRSTLTITLTAGTVGKNRMGALRATSNSNITVNTMNMGEGSKVAAALGATLTISAFTVNPLNKTLYFGGEGTIDFGYALGGTLTTVAIVKEDSGTLKMSTNDKTYLAPTNINGGIVWCDGPTRISNSNLVTVANGARLRAGYSNIGATALSVKALTLAAGSTVQVG